MEVIIAQLGLSSHKRAPIPSKTKFPCKSSCALFLKMLLSISSRTLLCDCIKDYYNLKQSTVMGVFPDAFLIFIVSFHCRLHMITMIIY